MEMAEEDVIQREGDAVAHHLALRSFAAVKEQRLPLAFDYDAGNSPLDRWPRGGGSQEAQQKGH